MMPPLLSHYLETLGFLGSELGSIAAVAGRMSSSLLLETIAQLWYHLTSTHTQTSHFPQHSHTLHHSVSLLDNNNIVFFVKRTSETAAAVGAGAELDSSISAVSVDKLYCSSDSRVSHKGARVSLYLTSNCCWIHESMNPSPPVCRLCRPGRVWLIISSVCKVVTTESHTGHTGHMSRSHTVATTLWRPLCHETPRGEV